MSFSFASEVTRLYCICLRNALETVETLKETG